jgi:hypothetical protein
MRRWGAVMIVFAGLISIGGSLPLLGTAFSIIRSGQIDGSVDRLALQLTLLATFITVGFGVALVILRDRLASRWFGEDEPDSLFGPRDALRVGLILVGVSALATGLRSTIISCSNAVVQALGFSGMDIGQSTASIVIRMLVPAAVFGVFEIAIGVVLIVGSARFTNLLWTAEAPADALSAHVCPSCGAPFDPADYRDGVERRCAECREPLGDA